MERLPVEVSRRNSGEENWGTDGQGWEWDYHLVYPLETFEICSMYMYYLFKKINTKQKESPAKQIKCLWSRCWHKQPSCASTLMCLAQSSLAHWPLGSSPWLPLDSQYPPPASFVLKTCFRQAPLASISGALSWAQCHARSLALRSSACWSPPTPGQASQVTRQRASLGSSHCLGVRREWSTWLSTV